MRFKEGIDRDQVQFFTSLNDLVEDRHYVRLIDLFVEGFVSRFITCFQKGKKQTGRKAYHPGTLLKLYIYGYLNGVSSSRKLEKECKRNLEVMWLTCHLIPDHKTISDFRKENKEGIQLAFKELSLLLKSHGYIDANTISIDGSKIRANASLSIDLEGIESKLQNLDIELTDYLSKLEAVDDFDDELEEKQKEKEKLEGEIEKLRDEVKELRHKKEQLKRSGAKRLNLTDPDARIMKSRQGKHFCYNMQAAVDAKHQFIASSYVTSHEHDRWELSPMTQQIENELGIKPKELLADAGYYTISQIEELERKSINCYVAINQNQQQSKEVDFTYDTENNRYICSQGQPLLPKNGIKIDRRRGTKSQAYVGMNCEPCPVRSDCTASKARTVYRFSNQQWRDQYEAKLKSDLGKKKLIQRKSLSEHPFGTIKYWMGSIPLKTRGISKVSTEIALYSLCYNLKRLMNLESHEKLVHLLSQGKTNNNCRYKLI